jgi:hypothetical protein
MSLPIDERHGIRRIVLGNDAASIIAAVTGIAAAMASHPAAHSDRDLLALIKAIRATFPVVCRLMAGRAECDAIHEYVRDHAAAAGVLLDCGESLSRCLKQFPVADDLPFLSDLAQFEWARARALRAPALTVDQMVPSGIGHGDILDLSFALHPSLSLIESPWPVDEIWKAGQLADGPCPAITASAQMTRLLVFRSGQTAASIRLARAPMSFMQAIGCGGSLRSAIEVALRADGEFDVFTILRSLLDRGLVIDLVPAKPRT